MQKLAVQPLVGESGEHYLFGVYNIPMSTEDQPSNLVYVYVNVPEPKISMKFEIIYVGETERTVPDRMAEYDDEKRDNIFNKHNATRVLIMTSDFTEDRRREIESDLIAAYDPPCNLK